MKLDDERVANARRAVEQLLREDGARAQNVFGLSPGQLDLDIRFFAAQIVNAVVREFLG